MNSWLAWGTFALVALILGLVGYHFSLRVLRVAAAFVALATLVGITAYGLTYPVTAPGSFSDAFARGADALTTALFQPLPVPPGHHIPDPGRIGWLIITVLLVIGYRELEAWSLHCHARSLDTSALHRDRQNSSPGEGKDVTADVQSHDRLAAELKFRLPAVEVRSPAILPGGSRSGGLASIAETSGVTGSGLAGAIIRFFGMLWPRPRRIRVRVWVESAAGQAEGNGPTSVTVGLDDPGTGASIATKTLAAGGIDDAASVVAGYVAQHIFAEDPTAPPWCTGAADGRDLAAILLARQVRIYPESKAEVCRARSAKIQILENVAHSNLCAGVARYELAHLYDLDGRHVEALLLHAKNREQYPRFCRGRYRLAMSLEMIANPDPGRKIKKAEVPALNEALKILHQCDTTRARPGRAYHVEAGPVDLPDDLRAYLLDTAWTELRHIRRYLTLWHVIWASFWNRDERGVLKPYWQLPYRQAFHDGVRVAQLLVAVRRALSDQEQCGSGPAAQPEAGVRSARALRLRRTRNVMRIATTIAGDSSAIARVLHIPPDKRSGHGGRPVAKRLRTRCWPGQYRTRSWQAAYNLACVYAALAQDPSLRLGPGGTRAPAQGQPTEDEVRDLVTQVVTSLEFALNNRDGEMERPSEWIANDPDFRCLRSRTGQFSTAFGDFLDAQQRRDYPRPPRTRREAAACRSPRNDLVSLHTVGNGSAEVAVGN
jgi:hypothetical protein